MCRTSGGYAVAWYGSTQSIADDVSNAFMFFEIDKGMLLSPFQLIKSWPATAGLWLKQDAEREKVLQSQCQRMEERMEQAFALIETINQRHNMPELRILDTQLNYPSLKTGAPNLNSCYYVGFSGEQLAHIQPDLAGQYSLPLLNFTITPTNIHVEFRHPGFFTDSCGFADKGVLRHQRLYPYLLLSGRFAVDSNDLAVQIIHYIACALAHLEEAGRLGSRSQSLAEYVIRRDLEYTYGEECAVKDRKPQALDLQFLHPSGLNVAIEVQGREHYRDKNRFGNWEAVTERDRNKRDWCREHKVLLIALNWALYNRDVYHKQESVRIERTRAFIDAAIQASSDGSYYVAVGADPLGLDQG
jgi:hypothetical protein